MAGVAIGAAVGGALIGRFFVWLVATLKKPMWPVAPPTESCEVDRRWASIACTCIHMYRWACTCMHMYRWACGPKTRQVLVRAFVGLAVGLLSLFYPQTLFWGEGSLQHVLDGQHTPLSAVWPGLADSMTARALVDVGVPFPSAGAALAVGVAKLAAIALACAGGFPGMRTHAPRMSRHVHAYACLSHMHTHTLSNACTGGIIFPLFIYIYIHIYIYMHLYRSGELPRERPAISGSTSSLRAYSIRSPQRLPRKPSVRGQMSCVRNNARPNSHMR